MTISEAKQWVYRYFGETLGGNVADDPDELYAVVDVLCGCLEPLPKRLHDRSTKGLGPIMICGVRCRPITSLKNGTIRISGSLICTTSTSVTRRYVVRAHQRTASGYGSTR